MALDQNAIVSYLREQNPEFYQDYTDAEIYRGVVSRNPQLADKFEYEPEGVTRFEKFGGAGGFWDTGEVLTHTERFKQFFPKIAQDIDVGLTGVLFNNPELANERRRYYDAINEHIFENNPRLQADIHWKQTEPGWSSFDAAARAFSEAAPSLAVSIGGMVAGTGVSALGAVGGVPGVVTTGAAYLTAMSPILLMETGSHYTEAMRTFVDEYGMSPEEAQDYAQVSSLAYGAISSTLELLGVKHFAAVSNSILKGIGRESIGEAGDRILTQKAMRKIVDYGVDKNALIRGTTRVGAGATGALSQGLVEGATESLQSMTGMTIQRAMEMGAEDNPADILDRLQGAFVEASKEKQWLEEGFAGFTTGIFGLTGALTRGTVSQERYEAMQESLRKADADLETELGEVGIDIAEDETVSTNLFGRFLDSVLDPKIGGEVQELADEDGGALAGRIKNTEEIEEPGFKILEAVGANKDLVDEIANHENSDSLLDEVRKVLNLQRPNSPIAEGDNDTIIKQLELFSNYGRVEDVTPTETETFGEDEPRAREIVWDTHLDEGGPSLREIGQTDDREQGEGPDNQGGQAPDIDEREGVASGQTVDEQTDAALRKQLGGQGTTEVTQEDTDQISLLENKKKEIIDERNKLPKNDEKGRVKLGKQIYEIEKQLRAAKAGETVEPAPETEDTTTIGEGDTVNIISGKLKGYAGKIIGETSSGKYWRMEVEGIKKPRTVAKTVVEKPVKEEVVDEREAGGDTGAEIDDNVSNLIVKKASLEALRETLQAQNDVAAVKKLDNELNLINIKLKSSGVDISEVGSGTEIVTPVKEEGELTDSETFIVHSGGAENTQADNRRDSADLIWEDKLKEKGVVTQSHSFQGHKQGGENKIVHSQDELKAADEHIDKANETLGRSGNGWTTNLNGYVINLFRRNWYQVKDASQVVAVGNIGKDGKVEGGTAVAVQMAIDNNKPVFIFDQKTNLWKTWDGEQFVTTDTPTLTRNSATIGSRQIGATGKAAIDDVINQTFVKDPDKIKSDDTGSSGVYRSGITAKDVHNAADEIGMDVDTDEFRSLSKQIVGEEHIDNMSNNQKGRMIDHLNGMAERTFKEIEEADATTKTEDVHPAILEERQKRHDANVEKQRTRSLKELRAVAKENGFPNASKMSKKQIIEALENKTPPKLMDESVQFPDSKEKLQKIIDDYEAREGTDTADPDRITITPEQQAAIDDPTITYSIQDAMKGEPVPPKNTDTSDPTQRDKDSEADNSYDEEQDLLQQKGSSREILASEDKALRNKILKRLKKHFPHVDVKTFDGVLEIYGMEVVGWATERAIAWSTTDATLDTIPHEFAHIYVKMLANEKIIQLGIKKYGSEEALVQAIGEYYTNRMRNKKLINNIKVWLKQFANRLKRYFGVDPKNKKDVMEFIAEEFFQGRWLGIEVEVGTGWIDFQERRTYSDLSELGNLIDEASGADGMTGEETDSSLKDYPTDLKLREMYNSALGIYIDKKHLPEIIEMAQDSKSFEEYRNKLWNWAESLTKKRGRKGDDKLRNQGDLNARENSKLHLDWIKANRRIDNWLRDDGRTKTINNRVYQHLVIGKASAKPEGLQIRGKRDLANDKDHPITSTRNFVEEDIRIGDHENRPILLPVKQILRKANRTDGSGSFYTKASFELNIEELERLQKQYSNNFITSLTRKIKKIKAEADAKIEDGVSKEEVKKEAIQSLIDLGGEDIGTTLLTIIGSKLGDGSAIISARVRETSMTLTPERFKNILDEAVNNQLIRPEHRDTMLRDANFEALEKSNKDIVNLPWSEYIVNKALDDDLDVDELFNQIVNQDLAFLGEMKNPMAQSLAQLRFWQDIRTPDYFMYENSASDSMVRLSIDLAEGPTPIGSGNGRLMIVDTDAKIRNSRKDHDNEAIEYDSVDGATYVGSGYMNKLAKSLGEKGKHKLWQLKTFIRQRTFNEETGVYDYLGMKHMMFTANDGMFIEDREGNEIARLIRHTDGLTYWKDSNTGELFDMIASPNEAKMTFGGFASTQQKTDAFGEGDYENGYYKVHEIDENSIAVTQISKGSKSSASHPIAFAEFLLDMGFESQEVQKLLKEIRGRYVDVLNYYTETVKAFHDQPHLLKEYIEKNRDANEIPDELEELIDLIGDDGMGIFHDSIYAHIKPVLNSRIIQDGINKARSYNKDSTILYLKPVTNLPLKQLDEETGHKGALASAQNATIFNYIQKLYFRSQGIRLDESDKPPDNTAVEIDGENLLWKDLSFGQKVDILNGYLSDNDTWGLFHRNPLQKVTAPVLRRIHKLVKGNHGETFFMSEDDVKNVVDGDWDGDKGAVEFISGTHAEAMQRWHESDAHFKANKVLKLEFFGERTDKDKTVGDTTALSRTDVHNEVSRNSKADGSTGVMVNAMTIAKQLFHKNFEMTIEGLDYTLRVGDFEKTSEDGVVMDYIPLSIDMINRNNGELRNVIKNNGDYIVDKDGNEINLDSKIESDVDLYLKTTKANELSLLFQMAVDGTKYRFYSEIIDNSGLTPFDFAISRMFERSDGKAMTEQDIRTLSMIYTTQNLSRQRGGRTEKSGIAASYDIAFSQSDGLLNRMNKTRPTDEQLLKQDKYGRVKGTKTDKEYSESFLSEVIEKIKSRWQKTWKGHSNFNISMENNITPVESLLMSFAHKVKQEESYIKHNHQVLRKEAHTMANQLLWDSAYVSEFYDRLISGDLQADYDAAEAFINEKMDIPDAGEGRISDVVQKYKAEKTKRVSFEEIWTMLKNYKYSQDAVKADLDEAYIGFTDRFLDKWESLTPEAQDWVTLRMLAGTKNTIYAMKLLPLKLQSKRILKRYYKAYGKAFDSEIFRKRVETAQGYQNITELPTRAQYNKVREPGMYGAMIAHVRKVYTKNKKRDDQLNVCGNK